MKTKRSNVSGKVKLRKELLLTRAHEFSMVCLKRVRRKKSIRNAEGYLDLTMVFDDRWPLKTELRYQLADKALESLEEITNPQGFKPYILFLKGQAHRSAGRYLKAINYLEQSLRLDEENSHTVLALAWCYKRVNKIDAAIEIMKTAIQLDSESAICHYNLACYYSLADRSEECAQHLSIALDINPEYRSNVDSEPDFDQLRDDPVFQAALNVAAQ